jgi:hypothetical protein
MSTFPGSTLGITTNLKSTVIIKICRHLSTNSFSGEKLPIQGQRTGIIQEFKYPQNVTVLNSNTILCDNCRQPAPKRQLLVLYTVSALMYLINIGLVRNNNMDLQHIMCFCPKNFAKPSSPSIKIIF